MFNDKYGLTQAVLEGRKIMTRRVINKKNITHVVTSDGAIHNVDKGVGSYHEYTDKDGKVWIAWSPYKIGDEVAIARSYEVLNKSGYVAPEWLEHTCESSAGYNNKMFVRADLMPHRIRITDIKMERLQDITEEEALLEGVYKYDKPPLHHERDLFAPWPPDIKPYKHDMDNLKYRATARYAFAYLVDKVCGGGTWKSNPWVFAYSFVLL